MVFRIRNPGFLGETAKGTFGLRVSELHNCPQPAYLGPDGIIGRDKLFLSGIFQFKDTLVPYRTTGKDNVNVLPLPSSDSTLISPLCTWDT
jgi:hypothetical protein